MPITNKQGTKKLTPAQKTEADKAHAANTAEVNRSVNEWRALQGFPPREKTDGK